jgi:RimJ/RimL family protein N-acetyltransferase
MGDVLHLPMDRLAPGPVSRLKHLTMERQSAQHRRTRPHPPAARNDAPAPGFAALRVQTLAGPIEGPEAVSLRPLTPSDLLSIDAWLQRPHVGRWWDADGEAWSQIVDAMDAATIAPFVITVEGVAVGYLELTQAGLDPVWRRFGVPDATVSIDLFLADATDAAHAIGATAVEIAAQALLADACIHRIQATPHPRNHALIDLLATAGFQPFGAMITPYGPVQYWCRERG